MPQATTSWDRSSRRGWCASCSVFCLPCSRDGFCCVPVFRFFIRCSSIHALRRRSHLLSGLSSFSRKETCMAEVSSETISHRPVDRWISVAIVAAAFLLGLVVLWRADHHPRTDDAEIFANFIGMAPQVEGPILQLNVRDNQFVKKGDLLFVVDPRPYEYAYEKTLSEQTVLEGQIGD